MHTNRLVAIVGMAALSVGSLTGLLTVTAAPAGATTVSNETSFTSAWQNAATTEIDLSANVTLTCTSGEPSRNSGTAILVKGNGHTLRQTCAGDRVVDQHGSGQISFSGITISGGDADGNGGAINTDDADIVVTDSIVTGNQADGEGGAIETDAGGAVTVTGSALTANSATGSGGAIAAGGLITLTRSTVSGNTSGNNGGGMRAYGGAKVVNSTVSNNTASGGGGIDSNNDVTLVYATITANTGSANLYLGDQTLTSFGSVVGLVGEEPNCILVGSTVSQGYNVDDDGSCGFGSGSGDQSDLSTNLGLAALAANGGVGQTRLPAAASPLVDQIPSASCGAGTGITSDQRGVTRPQGGACDIGAVELAVAAVTTTTTGDTTTTTAAQAVSASPEFTG